MIIATRVIVSRPSQLAEQGNICVYTNSCMHTYLYKILYVTICIFYLFIYLWLRWVFVAAHGLSLVATSGGYSLLRCTVSVVVAHGL